MLENVEKSHPADCFLNIDRVDAVWCAGCGIGTVVNTFIQAVEKLKINFNKVCVVSGIGCTGKVAEYLRCKSYSAANHSVIRYASHLCMENSDLKTVVFSNNADFFISGAEDLLEIGKRNVGLLVIHINNILYTITEYGTIPFTPFVRTSVNNNFELPFNIPHLAKSYGACYVARWAPLYVRRLMQAMIDALQKSGFSLIEVIVPCLMYYANDGRFGGILDRMRFFYNNSSIKQGENTENLDIRNQDEIVLGTFVDRK